MTEDGFEYAGTTYPSLTKIAKKITGAHWRALASSGSRVRTGATGATMANLEDVETAYRKYAMRDLHAEIVRGGPGASLQVADAQREACAAFVLSQKHEGWAVLPALYDARRVLRRDDGSPGPGSRLLGDIGAGEVDVVVVYKFDRLTRSLVDFVRMVEVFDARGVSFVVDNRAVQHDHLHGQADAERAAVLRPIRAGGASERFRDKITASKVEGYVDGRMPSLGYDVRN